LSFDQDGKAAIGRGLQIYVQIIVKFVNVLVRRMDILDFLA
jgi:hypothetical protein